MRCSIHSHSTRSCGNPSVETYLILLQSSSSVTFVTKSMRRGVSMIQRARKSSKVGKFSGFQILAEDVPSQRLRQIHSANKACTSVPRKLPCGKAAGATNCSCVMLEAAFNIFTFDQALY